MGKRGKVSLTSIVTLIVILVLVVFSGFIIREMFNDNSLSCEDFRTDNPDITSQGQCSLEFDEVCADNGGTYVNACAACLFDGADIQTYTMGVCE